jgi:hypothetical protein
MRLRDRFDHDPFSDRLNSIFCPGDQDSLADLAEFGLFFRGPRTYHGPSSAPPQEPGDAIHRITFAE